MHYSAVITSAHRDNELILVLESWKVVTSEDVRKSVRNMLGWILKSFKYNYFITLDGVVRLFKLKYHLETYEVGFLLKLFAHVENVCNLSIASFCE
jgi:hypothetical protein